MNCRLTGVLKVILVPLTLGSPCRSLSIQNQAFSHSFLITVSFLISKTCLEQKTTAVKNPQTLRRNLNWTNFELDSISQVQWGPSPIDPVLPTNFIYPGHCRNHNHLLRCNHDSHIISEEVMADIGVFSQGLFPLRVQLRRKRNFLNKNYSSKTTIIQQQWVDDTQCDWVAVITLSKSTPWAS